MRTPSRVGIIVGAVAVSAVAVSGCVSTNAAPLDTSLRLAPVCPRAVQVYLSPDRVGSNYREVALLNSRGESNWTNEAKMIASMRDKAASLGANGVILHNIHDASPGVKVAAEALNVPTERKGEAVAIWVPTDTARVRQSCAARS